MKLKLATIAALIVLTFFTSCASCDRFMKSCTSDVSGGLDRVVNVYSLNGELIATYEGKIDIDDNTNSSVMFDLNGKRYVYYNAIVEVIEK
jgi:predicted DCC family thiol-disulfide oxidoreductase YuxK